MANLIEHVKPALTPRRMMRKPAEQQLPLILVEEIPQNRLYLDGYWFKALAKRAERRRRQYQQQGRAE